MKKTLIIIAILVVAVAVVVGLSDNPKTVEKNGIDTSNWEEYQNSTYNFSLKYPSTDWNFASSTDDIAPKYSFYLKPAGVPVTAPFDHFANITNVSVYPHGIPTEGLLGERMDIGEGWGDNIAATSQIYVLSDGTPFAAYIQFNETPESWNESGFAWVRLRLNNFETICYRNGEEVTDEECDPLGSMDEYRIEHSGEIANPEFWDKAKEVIKSISFNN